MAKPAKTYVCQACGNVAAKWSGRCDGCGEWNTVTEETGTAPGTGGFGPRRGRGQIIPLAGLQSTDRPVARLTTGTDEFDRV
ncbi:MAG: DNA repair protein RadA, partial [Hyphomicrobiales bacterium]